MVNCCTPLSVLSETYISMKSWLEPYLWVIGSSLSSTGVPLGSLLGLLLFTTNTVSLFMLMIPNTTSHSHWMISVVSEPHGWKKDLQQRPNYLSLQLINSIQQDATKVARNLGWRCFRYFIIEEESDQNWIRILFGFWFQYFLKWCGSKKSRKQWSFTNGVIKIWCSVEMRLNQQKWMHLSSAYYWQLNCYY